jgi:hypothetical protein
MAFEGNDLLFGSGAKSMGFETPKVIAEMIKEGEDVSLKASSVRGRVTDFGKNHRRAYQADGKGAPQYWSAEGKPTADKTDKPVLDPVLTLQTTYRDFEGAPTRDEDGQDFGLRRIFLKGRKAPNSAQDAIKSACAKAGVRAIREGDYVELICTKEGKRVGQAGRPVNRSVSPPKEFEATYWTAANPPEWAAECDKGLELDIVDDEGDDGNPFDDE